MRIELNYTSSCPSSKKLREQLEDIIAEERLPLAIEVVEDADQKSPVVLIHNPGGVSDVLTQHEIDSVNPGASEKQFLDNLRRVVLEKWHDHAINPLSHLR